jgi:Pyridoxamine 5'-phosphate oxidase
MALESCAHMIRGRLRKFVGGGISIIAGTVDAAGVPACCRAIALCTKDEFETVTLYLPVATAQDMVANIATTRRVAVTCAEPPTHETIQIKGVARNVSVAPQEDRALVAARLEALADALADLGMRRSIILGLAHWPAFAIDISVEQIFDQTPGPRAGEEMR